MNEWISLFDIGFRRIKIKRKTMENEELIIRSEILTIIAEDAEFLGARRVSGLTPETKPYHEKLFAWDTAQYVNQHGEFGMDEMQLLSPNFLSSLISEFRELRGQVNGLQIDFGIKFSDSLRGEGEGSDWIEIQFLLLLCKHLNSAIPFSHQPESFVSFEFTFIKTFTLKSLTGSICFGFAIYSQKWFWLGFCRARLCKHGGISQNQKRMAEGKA